MYSLVDFLSVVFAIFVSWPACITLVTTTDDEGLKYSDNKWHHFVVRRFDTEGLLILDDKWTGNNRPLKVKIHLISAAFLLFAEKFETGSADNFYWSRATSKSEQRPLFSDFKPWHCCTWLALAQYSLFSNESKKALSRTSLCSEKTCVVAYFIRYF